MDTMPNRRTWTAEEEAYLRDRYPDTLTSEIALHLRMSVNQVYQKASRLDLAKSPAYIKKYCRLEPGHDVGKATQFRKGQVPANKGTRRPGWGPGRMKETQFRKGNRAGMAARNWVPVGTILSDGEGFSRIKVREAEPGKEASGFGNSQVWPLLNRWLWEQHYGPIPDKHIVTFKDGDRSNCSIENLELMSMADNARRNSMWGRYPQELIDVVVAKGRLKKIIKRRSNANKEHAR